MLTLVAYDISQDKPRTRMHKYLKELGLNSQRSVFECEIEADARQRVAQFGTTLLDHETDSLRIYPICERCARKVQVQGQGILLLPRAFEVV